jgi:hypothetical protein
MQDTQTLKAKIIALLDFLPPDNLKVLAEFAAFLRLKSDSSIVAEEMPLEITTEPRRGPIRIVSPHLVHQEQVVDFKLEVIEEATQ